MSPTRPSLMPAGVFQAAAIVLFLQCVFALFIRFDAMPSLSATYTNEWGESITFNGISYATSVFYALVAVFWIFVAVKGFRKNCIVGAIGAVVLALSFVFSSFHTGVIAGAVSSGIDYDSIKHVIASSSLPSWLLDSVSILGMLLLAIKGDISKFLKTAFILYPVMSVIAFSLLFGHKWYIWFQIVYAIALVVFTLKSYNKAHQNQL